MSNQQLPPHSAESERAVIGSLLIDPDALYMINDFLKPEDFYIGHHGLIYRLIQDIFAEGLSVDVITLGSRLSMETKQSENEEIGRLIGFTNEVPTALNVRDYARTVEATSIRRKMIRVGGKIAALGYDEKQSIDIQLDTAETMVFEVRGERSKDGMSKPRQYAGDYLDWFMSACEEPKTIGLPTGFIDLDRLLDGLQAPWQYVLAARPGMGKSSMAGQIAVNATLNHGKRVAFFALEMSKRQLTNRIAAYLTGINSKLLKRPWELPEHNRQMVREVVGRLSDSRLFIDDTSGISPAQVRAKTMRLYAEHGLDLVIVDHLHIMRPDRNLNRQDQEYGEMTKTLAELGKQINAPILTLAQLNRSVEARQNKRPIMSDLRESGAIEENAYGVMFLYRDDYYNELSERPNVCEVIVAKNRDGETGTADLVWQPQTTSFKNMRLEAIKL